MLPPTSAIKPPSGLPLRVPKTLSADATGGSPSYLSTEAISQPWWVASPLPTLASRLSTAPMAPCWGTTPLRRLAAGSGDVSSGKDAGAVGGGKDGGMWPEGYGGRRKGEMFAATGKGAEAGFEG